MALAEPPPRMEVDAGELASRLFRHDHWTVARAVLRSVQKPRARVAVKACHASSKTFTAADVVLLALIMGGDVLTTAPTWTQVEEVLWPQIHATIADSLLARSEWGHVTQTKIRLPSGEFALGLSTNEAVRFQGYHARAGRFLLIVIDEAPGVSPAIYEAIEGIRAGGDVRVLALGNPTIPSGPFYEAFTTGRKGWDLYTIDAFDTPNFEDETQPGHQLTLEELLDLPEERLDWAPRPYLVTRRFVREKYDEWGGQSPLWESRVRGQFPSQSEDSLIALAWLEAARKRTLEPNERDIWAAGIDVAGPGEAETVLTIRHGGQIELSQAWGQADPRGAVVDALRPYRDRLQRINVDEVGQGYYFALALREAGYEGQVVGVNVGEAARDKERYVNLKAELYWGLRLRFQAGDVGGLVDDLAISQLASIRYHHNARGQVVIESKDEARRRGVKSPDRAEALMLAFCEDLTTFAPPLILGGASGWGFR